MADDWHVRWLREGAEAWNNRRERVAFKPDLREVVFADLLPSADAADEFFSFINLNEADLTGANFRGVSFAHAKFRRATIIEARMEGADFNMGNFYRADMRDSSAVKSNFSSAKFRRANVEGVDFTDAILSNAVFVKSNLNPLQASTARSITNIVLPGEVRNPAIGLRDPVQMNIEMEEMREDVEKLEEQGIHLEMNSRPDEFGEGAVYTVFYGTNRKATYSEEAFSGYSGERSDLTDYGICEVRVPHSHRIGSIGSPFWKRLIRGDDRLSVDELIQLNDELFWNHVEKSLIDVPEATEPTLFIHGFNTTFEQAAIRSAQIGFDLGIGGGIGLFSWPSAGSVKKYTADEAAMEASKYALAEFIERYASLPGGGRINIIAHSMGCRCLLLAMELIAARSPDVAKRIHNMILAAADVDQGIMKRLGAIAIANPIRSTSYASTMDRAVELSYWLHDFPRVGLCPPVFIMDGMDTVLVNNTDLTVLGHGYVSSSREVLADIFQLLAHGASPKDRFTVRAMVSDVGRYWKIKD